MVCCSSDVGALALVSSAEGTAAVPTKALTGTGAAAEDAVEVEELGAKTAEAAAGAVEVGQLETGTAADVAVDVVAAPGCAPPGCRAVIKATMRLASQLRPRASVCIKLVNSATIAARPSAAAVAVGLWALTLWVGEGDSSVSV